MKILVTGATGFIGTQLVPKLKQSHDVEILDARQVSDTNSEWHQAVDGCEVLIHLAARAHVTSDGSNSQHDLYRSTNSLLTSQLSQRLALGKDKHFIFMSTAKVLGGSTKKGKPFKSNDHLIATDPYSSSKGEAEQELQNLCDLTSLKYTVIRPPLVYGPGVKANFLSMMKWVNDQRLLPLANTQNLRSFVGIRNLVSLIETCVTNDSAQNQILHVSDNHDLSTTELLQILAEVMGKKSRLVSFPRPALRLASQIIGKPRIYEQLCGSFQLDISQTCELLNWSPPFTVKQELEQTVTWFNSKPK
ncbi:MAG: NAD-dependent epimerase/dehydratase family protein [Actinobacteria bacterium]|nr:NAD-dependent epimerase/dehydratase family protein [Actinomycetota bacterium]